MRVGAIPFFVLVMVLVRANITERGEKMSEIQRELSAWIDTGVIAEAILDELKDQGKAATVGNGKTVWLDVLENELPIALKSSVRARL